MVEFEAGGVYTGASARTSWPACGPGGLCSCNIYSADAGVYTYDYNDPIVYYNSMDCVHRDLFYPPTFAVEIAGTSRLVEVGIALKGNKITAANIPEGHFDLVEPDLLVGIELSDNPLYSIPKIKHGNLKVLCLSNARIADVADGILDGLPVLRRMLLNGNMLTVFPKLQHANLEWLDLQNNQITELVDGIFAGLPSLIALELDLNPIMVVEPCVVSSFMKIPYLEWTKSCTDSNTLCPSSADTRADGWLCRCGLGLVDTNNTPATRPSNVIDAFGCLQPDSMSTTALGVFSPDMMARCLDGAYPRRPNGSISSDDTPASMGATNTTGTTNYNYRNYGGDDDDDGQTGSVVGAVLGTLAAVTLLVGVAFWRTRNRVLRNQSIAADYCNRVATTARNTFVEQFGHVIRSTGAGLNEDRAAAIEAFNSWRSAVSIPRASTTLATQALTNGRYGECRKVTLKSTSTFTPAPASEAGYVAKLCNSGDQQELGLFCAEAFLVGALQHPSILGVVALVLDGLPAMVVTPFMERGDLKTYLRRCRPTVKARPEVLGISELLVTGLKLVQACEFLESRKVVHRALMTANVLVGKDHESVRLSGFGSLRGVLRADEYVKVSKGKATEDQHLDIRY